MKRDSKQLGLFNLETGERMAKKRTAKKSTTAKTAKPKRKRKQKELGLDLPPAVHRRDMMTGRVIRRELTARTAAEALGDISPGCELYCLTMGKFSFIDVIEHLLTFTGPASCLVSTWTAANADINFANRLLVDGRLTDLKFVVDWSFISRQPAYCAALREAFGDDAIRITKNHAKFVLLRNESWNIVVRTSMNLNECSRLETLEVSDDPGMASWLAEVCDELFEKQSGAFDRRPIEHVDKFGEEWGACDPPNESNSRDKRYFSDEPTGIDLRRAGVARRT